ncbi:hypothetical protein D1007_26668 [Hordeum vulgare]|nr:hypothetical protein D1007_26668 [Hordeum vulgare]
MQDFTREAKAVLWIPSFQVIVVQGLTGSFLWSTLFKVATSLGRLFGGKMGDVLTRRLRNSGCIILAQISAGSAISLVGVLLLALPYDPVTFAHHGAANLAAVRRQIGLQLKAAWILSMVNTGLHVSRMGRVAASLSASSGSHDCSCICLRHGQQFLLLHGAAPPACAPPGWLLLCSYMLVRCCFFHVMFAILLRGAAFD